MVIEIPHDVALFLNYTGVPYPDINEDQVHTLGTYVRNFASGVASTHNTATGVIKDMGKVYSGYSYQGLASSWARMSTSHMADMDAACGAVADSLEAAALAIRVAKVAVLSELAGLATSYAAAMTAAIATDGLSAAIGQAIAAAARKLCEAMTQALIGYIVSEVIEKAVEPLKHAIDRMIHGIVDDIGDHLLGTPLGKSDQSLYIEPDAVLNYTNVLSGLADDILRQASDFADKAASLDFTSSRAVDDGTYRAPALNLVANPTAAAESPGSNNHHSPTQAAYTPPIEPPGVQAKVDMLGGHARRHAATAMFADPAETAGHPAHQTAGRLPAVDTAPHTGPVDTQPNPHISDETISAAGTHVAAGTNGGVQGHEHILTGASSGPTVPKGDADVIAQHEPGGAPAGHIRQGADGAQSSMSDSELPSITDSPTIATSAMQPYQSDRSLESADDAHGLSSLNPPTGSGRAGQEALQRVTPWRKRPHRKAVRKNTNSKATPDPATPWTGRTVPPNSETIVFAPQGQRPTPKRTDQPSSTARTEDSTHTSDSGSFDTGVPENESANATPQPDSVSERRRPTVVAPSGTADNRPEPTTEIPFKSL